MLLVYPPVAKPCEAPAGIAKLSGALGAYGIKHTVLDANLEGLLYLLQQPQTRSDTWTDRAYRGIAGNLDTLKTRQAYSNIARYQRAVMDINRVVASASAERGASAGLSNYQHPDLSPLRSGDLIHAAEHPEENPYYPYFEGRLTGIMERDQPALAGFSVNFLSQALCAFAMIGFLRKRYPGTKIILGGGLVTSWVRTRDLETIFGGLADRFIAGPGEHDLLLMHGIRDDERKQHVPDYGLLPVGDYLAPGAILPYSGSIGCWWNKCSFCPERAEHNPFIPVPAGKMTDDLGALTGRIRPALIHMLDNSMTMEHMRALVQHPPGAPWYGFARVGRELADYDFCAGLKRSGCVMLKLGLESGDQGVLDEMQKGIELETASQALRMLKRAGIAAYVYLIFGTPAETRASAGKTLDFIAGHIDTIGFLNLAIFNMPVYGEEARQFGTRQFYEGDLSLYTDFRHPKGWDRKHVRRFLDAEFKKHPAIAQVLKREPAFFTSNHAPFFVM